MFAIRICNRLSIRHLHHLVNAASRRVHLDTELAIGGARLQAQAAMDTAVEVFLLRSVRDDGKVGHD